MMFNPKEYLIFANDIINDDNYNEQARYRSSISRAYYAAFLVARDKLKVKYPESFKDKDEDNENIHKKIIEFLRNRTMYPHIGDMLFNLRRRRNKADYNMNYNFNMKTANKHKDDADDTINEIDNEIKISSY